MKKSDAIRGELSKFPTLRDNEIIKNLGKRRIEVSSSQVSSIRKTLREKQPRRQAIASALDAAENTTEGVGEAKYSLRQIKEYVDMAREIKEAGLEALITA